MSEHMVNQGAAKEGEGREGAAELGYSPSGRDRAIYQAICLENRPAAGVGREFDLAATTVRNIAHETQRKLARRQHELDQRGTAEALAGYFSEFKSQVDQLYRAWEASCEPVDRVVRITTRKGRPESRAEEGLPPGVSCEQVVEREVPLYRPARPDVRCMLLANRIVRDMLALEAQYKEAKATEESPARRGPPPAGGASPPPNGEALASDAPGAPVDSRMQGATMQPATTKQAATEQFAAAEVALDEIRGMLPPLAPGQTREFKQAGNGAWEVRDRPPRPKEMSRRQRHRQAQEREREGGPASDPPQRVSGAPQLGGGQRGAELHLGPEPAS